MKKSDEALYQAREFASQAGVSVRTLHHYDRLGLLKPNAYTGAGYRLYRNSDLTRLQQIITLKFIGFPLRQIKKLLDRNEPNLPTALRRQREIMNDKREHLGLAIQAIERAERAIACSNEPDWEIFRNIIEVINMQNNMDWTKKYYSESAKEKLAGRANSEVIEQGQKDWAQLIKDVETAIREGEDPQSEKARALGDRWSNLIQQFTGGDPEISQGLNELYSDQANWPAHFKKPYSDEVGAFICAAMVKK